MLMSGYLGAVRLGLGLSTALAAGLANEQLLRSSLNNGDGLALDFLTDTALVVDSGTPANDYFSRIRDLLTVTNTLKHVTGPDGNLRYQAHNICTYSEDLSSWSAGTATITESGTIQDLTAWQISDTGSQTIGNACSAGSQPHWGGVYIKAGTNTGCELRLGQTGNYVTCVFDLDAGTAGTPSSAGTGANENAGITDLGGGEYLIWVSGDTLGTGSSITLSIGVGTISAGSGTLFATAGHVRRLNADETYVATTSAAKYGLALDHDVTTLDSSSTSVSVGTGKRTFTLAGSEDYRTATTAWADATSYSIGDQRQVNNRSYTCTVAHTSSGSNKPSGEGNAYWKRDEKTLRISDQSDVDGKYLIARVDYQTGTTLVVDVLRAVGSGSASSWHVIEAKGALIEEARTNLCVQSNDFSTTWGVRNTDSMTVTTNQATAPDGATTLDLLEITDATNEEHEVNIAFSYTANNNVSFTFHASDDDQRYLSLRFYTSDNNWATVIYDLQAGSVTQESTGATSGTVVDSGVLDRGGGLYELWFTASINETDATARIGVGTVSGGTPTLGVDGAEAYAGTLGLGFYVGFVQIEAGSFPTSYTATNGSTVARAADVLSLATSKFAFSATEGMVYTEASVIDASQATNTIWSVSDGTNNERIYGKAYSGQHLYAVDGGVGQVDLDVGGYTSGTSTRAAAVWKVNDYAISLEGAPVGSDTSATVPTVDTLGIGQNATSGKLNGHIRSLIYTPTRETNAALQARSA